MVVPPPRPGAPTVSLQPGLMVVFEQTGEWCVLLERGDLVSHISDWECTSTGEVDIVDPTPIGDDAPQVWVWSCMWGSPPGPAHYASLGDMGYGITERALEGILSCPQTWTLMGNILTVHQWSLIDGQYMHGWDNSGGA